MPRFCSIQTLCNRTQIMLLDSLDCQVTTALFRGSIYRLWFDPVRRKRGSAYCKIATPIVFTYFGIRVLQQLKAMLHSIKLMDVWFYPTMLLPSSRLWWPWNNLFWVEFSMLSMHHRLHDNTAIGLQLEVSFVHPCCQWQFKFDKKKLGSKTKHYWDLFLSKLRNKTDLSKLIPNPIAVFITLTWKLTEHHIFLRWTIIDDHYPFNESNSNNLSWWDETNELTDVGNRTFWCFVHYFHQVSPHFFIGPCKGSRLLLVENSFSQFSIQALTQYTYTWVIKREHWQHLI